MIVKTAIPVKEISAKVVSAQVISSQSFCAYVRVHFVLLYLSKVQAGELAVVDSYFVSREAYPSTALRTGPVWIPCPAPPKADLRHRRTW